MTTNNTMDLRAALQLLAEQAPTVDSLDHTAWSGRANGQPVGQRPRRRLQLGAIASAVVVVAALVVGTQLIHRQGTTPASSGRAVLEVRPLVAPGVPVMLAGTRSTNPLQAMTFPIPSTAAEYNGLSAADRQQLLAALASTDCTHQTASTAAERVACSPVLGGRQLAFLLGPALFGNDQIKSARPVAPSVGAGQTEWTIALELRQPAAAAFALFTTAHHISDAVVADVMRCGVGSTPCGDYLGFVVNGSVVTIPVTAAPINGGAIQISGNFDKQSATTLAQQLTS